MSQKTIPELVKEAETLTAELVRVIAKFQGHKIRPITLEVETQIGIYNILIEYDRITISETHSF